MHILKPKPPIPALQLNDRWRLPFFGNRFRAERDLTLVEEWKLWKLLIFKLSPSLIHSFLLSPSIFFGTLFPNTSIKHQVWLWLWFLCCLLLIFFFWRQFRKDILNKTEKFLRIWSALDFFMTVVRYVQFSTFSKKFLALLYIIIYCVEVGIYFALMIIVLRPFLYIVLGLSNTIK